MHPRIEHLLSLRDGEPVAAGVSEHVAQCRTCSRALQDANGLRERLRALPSVPAAPAAGWQAIQAKMAARSAAAARRATTSRIAAAASLAVIALALSWRAADDIALPPAGPGRESPLAMEETLALDRVVQLQTQSHALEEILSTLGDAPVVERAGTALPIDTLEAQVQWIDHQLSLADDLEAGTTERLWRERVNLMNSLVQLRYVDAQRIAM